MKLHDNQMKLLRHLARFNLLDYPSCLRLLDTAGTGDAVSLSYAFRPLTKYDYPSKRDNCVSILSKGRALFPDVSPLIAAGGGAAERERVMQVSRMALLMEENGIPCRENRIETKQPYFIPSACWRKIAPGILSTTRFTGMLIVGNERYRNAHYQRSATRDEEVDRGIGRALEVDDSCGDCRGGTAGTAPLF